MQSLKSLRSSPRSMASRSHPIISMPYSSSTPDLASSTAVLSPVCPPSVGRIASGRSRSMTFFTNSAVIGSTYVRSASPGSVMMVAGFELTRTTR